MRFLPVANRFSQQIMRAMAEKSPHRLSLSSPEAPDFLDRI